jgi:hypothetical protein
VLGFLNIPSKVLFVFIINNKLPKLITFVLIFKVHFCAFLKSVSMFVSSEWLKVIVSYNIMLQFLGCVKLSQYLN